MIPTYSTAVLYDTTDLTENKLLHARKLIRRVILCSFSYRVEFAYARRNRLAIAVAARN